MNKQTNKQEGLNKSGSLLDGNIDRLVSMSKFDTSSKSWHQQPDIWSIIKGLLETSKSLIGGVPFIT
jgi:hypothetical protein